MLRSPFYIEIQERERELIKILTPYAPLNNKKIIEIGYGTGGKILQLIQLGFNPHNITANELLPDEIIKTKEKLASAMWSWLQLGGTIIWYAFIFNNPKMRIFVEHHYYELKSFFLKQISQLNVLPLRHLSIVE